MPLNHPQNQCFSDRIHAVIRLIPAVFVILILATQSFAVTRMDGGTWIEICGENGAEMVRIDGASPDAGSGDFGECPDCGDCLFCAVASVSLSPLGSLPVPSDYAAGPVLPGGRDGRPVAALFWHQSRAPPTGKTKDRRAPTW